MSSLFYFSYSECSKHIFYALWFLFHKSIFTISRKEDALHTLSPQFETLSIKSLNFKEVFYFSWTGGHCYQNLWQISSEIGQNTDRKWSERIARKLNSFLLILNLKKLSSKAEERNLALIPVLRKREMFQGAAIEGWWSANRTARERRGEADFFGVPNRLSWYTRKKSLY